MDYSSVAPPRAKRIREQIADQRRRSPSPRLDDLIERMALSADCNLDALDRMLRYRQRAIGDVAKRAFDRSFSAMQLALPTLTENGEIRDRAGKCLHTYAMWEDINEVIKPILTAHGFALYFRVENNGTLVAITAILTHIAGHTETTTIRLPSDFTGGKNGVQAIGSATSYGKRYGASALLNLTSRGDDDDGAVAGSGPAISPEQLDHLRSTMAEVGADEDRLVDYLKIESLGVLPEKRFQRALDAIKLKGVSP